MCQIKHTWPGPGTKPQIAHYYSIWDPLETNEAHGVPHETYSAGTGPGVLFLEHGLSYYSIRGFKVYVEFNSREFNATAVQGCSYSTG
jgi:hypothetical protein